MIQTEFLLINSNETGTIPVNDSDLLIWQFQYLGPQTIEKRAELQTQVHPLIEGYAQPHSQI